MLFISQITSFEDGTIMREVEYQEYEFAYTGKGDNIPVNIAWITTIKKGIDFLAVRSVREPNFEVYAGFPQIVFKVPDTGRVTPSSNVIIWWYPPTERGEKMRDMDFDFIMKTAAKKCPGIDDVEKWDEALGKAPI